MSRSVPGAQPRDSISHSSAMEPGNLPRPEPEDLGWELWLLRLALAGALLAVAMALHPFSLRTTMALGAGFLVAVVFVIAELRLRRAASDVLLGATFGVLAGAVIALVAATIISRTALPEPDKSFLDFCFLAGLGYLGLTLGARKGPETYRGAARYLESRAADSEAPLPAAKLLDTSVLIDGRIADICEAHFLDGPLLVPPFVLRELQIIADSADTLRRQRGRRGLEVLQRIQKMPDLEVRILEDKNLKASDADRQLIDLALRTGAKIVTNDFNLNKVATVQGISVLNVNELANALRPAVLPGESMRVFILREGKEANQGVAYLEDGTMVVVDGARRLINKTVDMIVTSVHQTPAGKMIFGRLEDYSGQNPAASRTPAGRAMDSSAPEKAGSATPESEIQ
jgi:uncharacterized protein YacL